MSCVREMHLLFLLPSLLLQPLNPCNIFVLSSDLTSKDPLFFHRGSSIAVIICCAAGKLLRFGRKGKGRVLPESWLVFSAWRLLPSCPGFLSSFLCDPWQAEASHHSTHKNPAQPAFCRDSLSHLLPENQELPHAASNEMKTDINPSAKPQHVT